MKKAAQSKLQRWEIKEIGKQKKRGWVLQWIKIGEKFKTFQNQTKRKFPKKNMNEF